MPAIKQPANKSAASVDPAEIRKLREEAEAIARDVARLNGRLDIIEALLPEIQTDTGSRSEPAIQ